MVTANNNTSNETNLQDSVQRTAAENVASVITDRQHVHRNNKADALAEPRYNAAETKTSCQHGGQSPERNNSRDRTKVTVASDGEGGGER